MANALSMLESQWNAIMESSIHSESATLIVDGVSYTVKGVFISGTFEEESSVAYAPVTYIEKEFFRMARLQLVGKISDLNSLPGSTLLLPQRGLKFRVYEKMGGEVGDIQLLLQRVTEGNDG